MYNSKYYTCEQIDQRLLEGYYDDAVAAGYTGSKAQYLAGLLKAINYSANPTITADKVVYNPAISGLTPKNIQDAIDELANKKANSEDVDSKIQTEQERVNAELDKKLDKENIAQEFGDSDDKVVSQFALPFREIESPEFIKAIVDAEDHFLFGIQLDGSIEWGKGIPTPIRIKLQEIINQCQKDKTDLLGSINTINGILDKTTIKDEAGEIQDTPFRVIKNDEYIIAVVDAENRILEGIKYDAQPYFPNHEMYSVITNKEWLYAIIDVEDKVLGGFRADDGHMVVGGIDVSTFIANAIIDVSDIKERTSHLFTIENDEYLSVETDVDGKVIGYTAPDGSHYIHNVKSETIPTEFEHIEDPEGRTEITTDADGRIMSYRDSSGKKHEHNMETKNLEVSNLNLKGNSVNNIQDALKANGFEVKTPVDWSEYTTQNGDYPLNLPTPRCARLNIISNSDLTQLSKLGLSGAVEGKNYNIPTVIEFWDMQGNYFKKNAYLSGQGSSSMKYKKKNIALDLFDSEVGGDSFSVKFGEWVPQDSFHLKAYYTDPFRGMCVIGYSIYNDIVKTRGLEKDYVWKRALLNTDAITPTNPIVDGKKEVLLYTESGARCFPDGFPCMVFQNGEFCGLYSFQLKKHRSNYCLNKKTAEHIHLDGNISETSLFNANGDSSLIQWKNLYKVGFEIRNPKSLYLMDGSEYDADLNSGELIDETSDFYDESKHKTSAKVKKYIINFSKTLATIKAAEDVYLGNKTDENLKAIKDTLETYFDSENLIDYLITCDVLRNTDGFADNWQWVTYNGVKWYVCLYDVDATLGNHWQPVQTINPPLDGKHVTQIISKISMMKYITTYYVSELEERYAYLRKNGIIDAERIITKIRDWMLRFGGQYAYELEANKWTDFVKNDNIFRVHKWIITEINNLDKVYHYNPEV